ncbi:MAG: hypothetical protein LUC26_00905 [Prevotella sp.]|nr:hypothetical protein [Prevotella sp.]
MRVYFYHTQDMAMLLRKFAAGELPPHFLYGATKLGGYGIDVVWHPAKAEPSRWKMIVRNTWKILTCREKYDVFYATHYRGLEIIVFLRALRLFRKPIAVWHHQPVITPPSRLRELVGRLFYKGFDHMFFFSEKLLDDSLKSRKARGERMSVAHWGMDIPSWSASGNKDTILPPLHFHRQGDARRRNAC